MGSLTHNLNECFLGLLLKDLYLCNEHNKHFAIIYLLTFNFVNTLCVISDLNLDKKKTLSSLGDGDLYHGKIKINKQPHR